MRLDKLLSQHNMGSRREVRELIRRGKVTVNGIVTTSFEEKVDETTDRIICDGQVIDYRPHVYYILNKPQGVVSATRDRNDRTVLDLILPHLPLQYRKRGIVPAGRLDKDTEGLLLLTDDGALIHRLLSPGRHVDKTYLVETKNILGEEDVSALEQGVDIGERNLTLPAKVEVLDEHHIKLTIHEGKFHQVKRMLQAVDNEVLSLKRLCFGPLSLDDTLLPGAFRELTEEEIAALYSEVSKYSAETDSSDDSSAEAEHIDMSGIEAVIFDLDGTLVDSMWIWHQIDIEYLSRFGIPLPERLQADIEGMSFHETAIYFKERFQIADSLEEIKENWNAMAWDKYEKEVPLKRGVEVFLEYCRMHGIRVGIATSNSRVLTENIVRVHGLRDYFDCIMTGCDVEKGKPSPDIYLAVADKLQVKPERCLVFEDILPGIMAGKNAGMRVCAVEDAYSADIRTQKQELADYYIKDYTELLAKEVS